MRKHSGFVFSVTTIRPNQNAKAQNCEAAEGWRESMNLDLCCHCLRIIKVEKPQRPAYMHLDANALTIAPFAVPKWGGRADKKE